jgi:hypothetical protein
MKKKNHTIFLKNWKGRDDEEDPGKNGEKR